MPEDRAAAGIFAPLPVEVNISAAIGRTIAPHGWIRRAAERQLAARAAADLDVRCASLDQPIEHLSGGNQQKAILARWLLRQPRLLMLDEPTRGIDVGAKLDFHRLLREYAAQGGAVLMVSSDLPELLALSDRILVMCEGRITAHLTRPQATEETVMHAAVPHARPSTTVAAMEIVA